MRERARSRAVAGALVVALAAGCSSGGGAATAADADVQLKDFSIKVADAKVVAGRRVLGLHNAGPTVHELVLVRTARPSYDLPLDKDGLSVDEDDAAIEVVDEMEQVQLGERHDMAVDLAPGYYVLFCNLEGHYLGGMYTDLVVDR